MVRIRLLSRAVLESSVILLTTKFQFVLCSKPGLRPWGREVSLTCRSPTLPRAYNFIFCGVEFAGEVGDDTSFEVLFLTLFSHNQVVLAHGYLAWKKCASLLVVWGDFCDVDVAPRYPNMPRLLRG